MPTASVRRLNSICCACGLCSSLLTDPARAQTSTANTTMFLSRTASSAMPATIRTRSGPSGPGPQISPSETTRQSTTRRMSMASPAVACTIAMQFSGGRRLCSRTTSAPAVVTTGCVLQRSALNFVHVRHLIRDGLRAAGRAGEAGSAWRYVRKFRRRMEQLVVCDGAGHVDGSAWHLLRPKHAAGRPKLLALPFSDRVPRPQQLQADRWALNGSNVCQCTQVVKPCPLL